jgi:hypothetical protein
MSEIENQFRSDAYRVDVHELAFLTELNDHLANLERELNEKVSESSDTLALLGGLQRSGTTLLYQLLARHCEVGYINNLIARFWKAPLAGVMLSRTIWGASPPVPADLTSDYGVTREIVGTHEFGYFWTHWLQLATTASHLLTSEEAARVDWQGLASCLRKMSTIFARPLVLKNPVGCWNASWLFPVCPELRLIIVRRELFFVAQSTYLARKKRYGDARRWWSLKPPGYTEIQRQQDPLWQVAMQVKQGQSILDQLISAYPNDTLVVDYQDIRQSSRDVVEQVASFCGLQLREGIPFAAASELPDGDRLQLPSAEAKRIETALSS